MNIQEQNKIKDAFNKAQQKIMHLQNWSVLDYNKVFFEYGCDYAEMMKITESLKEKKYWNWWQFKYRLNDVDFCKNDFGFEYKEFKDKILLGDVQVEFDFYHTMNHNNNKK